MNSTICPNYNVCRLVTTTGFSGLEAQRRAYMQEFCVQGEIKWSVCKRYITKKDLGFCPDFVLPDTCLSIKEIIDKFDESTE